jgi:hypothetical protein
VPLRGTIYSLITQSIQSLPLPSISHIRMSAPAAAAAAVSQTASPGASQQLPASFTDLHNHTQPPVVVNLLAGMHSQSLTQSIALPASAAAHTQFTQYAEVQQRLTTACTEYNKAATALKGALASRERFISSGSKQGSSKQLPAKLVWKLSKTAHLSTDGVPAGFYAADLTALRAIEHEATEKAFDALLAAKDKHITHLQTRCVLRDFISAAAADFLPHLQRIATAYNKESQADPLALSQSGFSFPTAYFSSELQSRLTAQALAKVQADNAEQQRVANDRAEEHKAQETVLTGASTGQTIAMVAERAVQQQLAPMQKQIAQLLQQLQLQQQKQPPRLHQHGRHQSRGTPQQPNTSHQWQQVRDALGEPSLPLPIIAYQSALSLVKMLVFQRARKLEEARKTQSAYAVNSSQQLDIRTCFSK